MTHPELFPVWKMLLISGAFREQRCPQFGISPEFGRFLELFWGVFRAATVALYIQELFWSFFEKKIRILCYFGSFWNRLVASGSFLGCLEPF